MKININDNIYNNLKSCLKETSFKNIENLIEYIIEEYIEKAGSEKKPLSVEEKGAQLNKRLKDLGYL